MKTLHLQISIAILILLMSPLAVEAGSKNIKLHGYVTEIRSQHSFDIDDFKITRESTLTLEFERDENSDSDEPFTEEIRIGTEVEIKGEYDPDSHELTARSIKVFPSETRKVKRTAIVESPLRLENRGSYWEGSFRVDGQTITVDERTALTITPNQSQSKARKEAAKAAKKAAPPEAAALVRLEDVHPNMYVSYEGVREKEGTIRALKLDFKDNELTPSEAKLWKSLTPKVKAFTNQKPGELRIDRVGKFKLVAIEEAQDYVRKLAENLVPANQRNLSGGDQNKIPFRIHLIDQKAPNAFACANGTVVVHSGLLSALENEAQFAFVIGHEIAHATQEHTLRQMEFHKKKRFALRLGAIAAGAYGAYDLRDMLNMISAAIANGYSRHLENQADRLGMEYMIAAGYDPREAPRSWKAMALKYGDRPLNFFWSSHDNKATRRSYLMAELRNNYGETEFASTRRDSDEFHRIVSLLAEPEKGSKKIKVKY